jgi:2-enoate reductase
VSPLKQEFKKLTEYYLQEIEHSNIQTFLNTRFTQSHLDEIKPDRIYVATGASPTVPDVPGIKQTKTYLAREAFHEDFIPGEKVLIIGGGLVGSELAIDLASKTKNITILEKMDTICANAFYANKLHLLELIKNLNIKTLTNTHLLKINGDIAYVKKDGDEINLKFDTLIIATGYKGNQTAMEGISYPEHQIVYIGDSVAPRKVLHAIWEAYRNVLFNTYD